jgi:mannose-6-phosphate isomerase
MKQQMAPLKVVENRIWRFYTGGGQLEALRGRSATDGEYPEEWVGSTTESAGSHAGKGLSEVEWHDGSVRVLKELIDEDPVAFLGAAHVERYGSSPGFLVKLLDPAERLPVHAHPSREFAHQHLDSPFGKTEAWIVLGTREDAAGTVHLGLRDEVPTDLYRRWVREQDTERILASLHELEVKRGDVILVPSGVPHAIGAGILLAEVQEPTDFSFMCEHDGYPIATADAYLGMSLDDGIQCLDLRPRSATEIEECRIRPEGSSLLHGACEPFFAADVLSGSDESTRETYQLVLATSGSGFLETSSGRIAITAGDGFVMPASLGRWALEGSVEALSFRGPAL